MSLNTGAIHGIIWDLDNTLYRFTDEFYISVTRAAASAAQAQGIDLSYDETIKLAERSEIEHGYSMHGYVVDHGIAYADLHFPFHDNIDETVIAPIDDLSDKLRALNIPHVILTNASRGWAKRVLKFTELDNFFSDKDITAMEDANFEAKSISNKGFKIAIEKLGLSPKNILMVDDLDRNLVHAHALGMQTAYLSFESPVPSLPPYITAQYKDVHMLLNKIKLKN